MHAPNSDQRILILAPSGQDGPGMAMVLKERRFQVEVCQGATEICHHLAAGAGALLLTEEALEQPRIPDLLEQLKMQPAWSEIPLIILTRGGEPRLNQFLELAAHAAGSITLLERPMGAATLCRSLEVALQSRRRQYQVRDLLADRKKGDEAKSRLAAIVASSEDAIISKDLKGVIMTWNHGAEELFGYTAEEAIGRSITMIIPPDRLNEEPAILSRICRGERLEHFETIRVRKDGTLRDISLTVSPIIDAAGRISGISKIARDITARKRSERALQKTQSQLETALKKAQAAARAKDQFLAAVSHELRTPLTPVLMKVSVLQEEEGLPQVVGDALRVIEQNIRVEARMVNDLLDFSRITNHKLDLNMERCNLHEVIQRSVDVCVCDGNPKELNIQLQLNARRHHLVADAMRLQQVFWNLIQNAIKFTPPGGRIVLTSRDDGDNVRVTVADTGRGIDEPLLERIFEPFEQGANLGRESLHGLGLGLAIAHRIVAAHGGTITAASPGLDCGATFTIVLRANGETPSNHERSELHNAPLAP